MKRLLQSLSVFILFISLVAQADIALLVHGYHSSGKAWRSSGIITQLKTKDWYDAGLFTPQGYLAPLVDLSLHNAPMTNKGKYLVTAELPSEAPIEIQAAMLDKYLTYIYTHFPQQVIHLIAHSAGGIVARLTLVNNYQQKAPSHFNIFQLITIATPHLGSPIAKMAHRAANSPIGVIAPLVGANEINRAQTLYQQLAQEDKNPFLFLLNRQAHPPMYYTSIIRGNGSLLKGDWLVPPLSQNMALVPAIGSHARAIITAGDHDLKYQDAIILMALLP